MFYTHGVGKFLLGRLSFDLFTWRRWAQGHTHTQHVTCKRRDNKGFCRRRNWWFVCMFKSQIKKLFTMNIHELFFFSCFPATPEIYLAQSHFSYFKITEEFGMVGEMFEPQPEGHQVGCFQQTRELSTSSGPVDVKTTPSPPNWLLNRQLTS